MSIEVPRQPSNLDPVDESALASIGHRIEIWQHMKEPKVPFEERKSNLISRTKMELDSLRRTVKEGDFDFPETALLEHDLTVARSLKDDTTILSNICNERVHYYTELRRDFLQKI